MFQVGADFVKLDRLIDKLDRWADFVEVADTDFHLELTANLKQEAAKHRRSGDLEKSIHNLGVGRWGNRVAGLTRVEVDYASYANAGKRNRFARKASTRAQKGLLDRLSRAWEAHFGYGV